jgi:antitoxin (DNA-binding transcriptional repressor) of toxin-antitoxin stability system
VARITATEAARSFSDVLNRIAAGEELEIVRNDALVAVIGPPRARFLTRDRFRELLASAPSPDENFVEDVRLARADAGPPPTDPWPS